MPQETASEDDASDDSGENDNLCHKSGKEGVLVRCDTCRHVWHEACLPADAMPVDSAPWECPVCAGSTQHVGFIGNPRQPTQRGSKRDHHSSCGYPTRTSWQWFVELPVEGDGATPASSRCKMHVRISVALGHDEDADDDRYPVRYSSRRLGELLRLSPLPEAWTQY